MVWVCSVVQCAKIQYCTHTHVTCFGNTMGLPVPVLNTKGTSVIHQMFHICMSAGLFVCSHLGLHEACHVNMFNNSKILRARGLIHPHSHQHWECKYLLWDNFYLSPLKFFCSDVAIVFTSWSVCVNSGNARHVYSYYIIGYNLCPISIPPIIKLALCS
jgi:hypothetical protein